MANLALSLACGDYDRTWRLIDGTVRASGLDLTVLPLGSPERHRRFTRYREFDVCELQLAVYLGWKDQGVPFTAIPVFPYRQFCHGAVVVHEAAGIARPEALRGKRVGIQAHFNPIAIWMRGVLQHEYGVRPEEITWVTNSREQVADWTPPPSLPTVRAPAGRTVDALLDAGELEAYMLPDAGEAFLVGASPGRRLWPDYRAVEADYFRRTGIFPIRHTVVVRDEILQRHPWVAQSLVAAFEEAKRLGREYVHDRRRSSLAWYGALMEEERAVLGADPWPYSLPANRVAVETFVANAAEQGLISRRFALEELFAPHTLD